MNGHEQWNQDNGIGMHSGYPPYYGPPPRRRSKWIAGLLSFLIPGVGHMYLGKMFKAIFIMLMIAGVITGIVQVATFGDNLLSILALSFLLSIMYFYSLFDAIQSTDRVNERLAVAKWLGNPSYPNRQPHPPVQPMEHVQPPQPMQPPQTSYPELRGVPLKKTVLLAIVIVLIFLLAQESWSEWKFDSTLSIIGAVLLVGAGMAMWIWEHRGSQSAQEPFQAHRPQDPSEPNEPEQ